MRPIARPLLCTLALLCALALSAPWATSAPAQVAVPAIGSTLDPLAENARRGLERVPGVLNNTLDDVGASVARTVTTLAQARLDRVAHLLRQNPTTVERDLDGNPARKGELLVMAPAPAMLDTARGLGFVVLGQERLGALDLDVIRLAVPGGMPLARAQAMLNKALPGATIASDALHFPAASDTPARANSAPPVLPPLQTAVGMIDGAPAQPVDAVQGFAPGAPAPSDHGSAVAGLLARAGVRHVAAADVYGLGSAGGNALAIARAIDWLIGRQVRVVTISLVGPANPVLGRAVAAALRQGAVIVAAVGNNGPAAPPAYPASYPGVLAVTALDARNRPLIEAGRALHLDYAAPGAGMRAPDARGRWVLVRGTSFAAPLVAARVAAARDAHAPVLSALDREAIDLGPRGPDAQYGRGLLCTICR